ncbi:MAG: enoyl-CoA hydratase/isomerase family protein [Hyphomonadaceae bacterium]
MTAEGAAPTAETVDFEGVQITFEGALATLLLNDPDRRNAVTPEMASAIAEALQEAAKPRRRVRCIYITGAGSGFCAGANLAGSAKAVAGGKGSVPALASVETTYHPALRRLQAVEIPVVAGVNGPCIGFGLGLALAADYVVCSDAAFFSTPFVGLASASDSGLTWTLPRIIGVQRARRMLLRGERVPAATALEWGLVSEVAPADQFAQKAREVAESFANGPTIAISEIKRLIKDGATRDIDTMLEAEIRAVARTSRTKDNVAAIRVFGKKERPVFTGE